MKKFLTIFVIHILIITALVVKIEFTSKWQLGVSIGIISLITFLIAENWISKSRQMKSVTDEIKEQSINLTSSLVKKYKILGKELDSSIYNIFSKIEQKEKPNIEDYSHFLGSIIRRVLRSGAIVLLIAMIPTIISLIILYQQNQLIEKQNQIQARQLYVQEYAIEKDKNDSYFNRVAEILKSVSKTDTISMNQIHNISSFTKFIEPPKYDLNTNDFLRKPISKAKADLLLGLTNINSSNAEIGQILLLANFRNSDFRHLIFSHKDFRWLKSENSSFSGSVIEFVDFRESILNGTSYIHSWLTKVDFSEAKLKNADFRNSHNYHCNFASVDFSNSDFREASFHNCLFAIKNDDKIILPNMNGVKVSDINWFKRMRDEINIGIHFIEEKYTIDSIPNDDYCGQYYLIKEKL